MAVAVRRVSRPRLPISKCCLVDMMPTHVEQLCVSDPCRENQARRRHWRRIRGVCFCQPAPDARTDLEATPEHISEMRCGAVTLTHGCSVGPRRIVPITIMHVLRGCVASAINPHKGCRLAVDLLAFVLRTESAIGRSINRDVGASSPCCSVHHRI